MTTVAPPPGPQGGIHADEAPDDFWDIASHFMSQDGVDEGTVFGFPCLRLASEFVAMPGNSFGGMEVKLSAPRVADLIESGVGSTVAPAGRPFREGVAVDDHRLWLGLIEEAIAFATRQ